MAAACEGGESIGGRAGPGASGSTGALDSTGWTGSTGSTGWAGSTGSAGGLVIGDGAAVATSGRGVVLAGADEVATGCVVLVAVGADVGGDVDGVVPGASVLVWVLLVLVWVLPVLVWVLPVLVWVLLVLVWVLPVLVTVVGVVLVPVELGVGVAVAGWLNVPVLRRRVRMDDVLGGSVGRAIAAVGAAVRLTGLARTSRDRDEPRVWMAGTPAVEPAGPTAKVATGGGAGATMSNVDDPVGVAAADGDESPDPAADVADVAVADATGAGAAARLGGARLLADATGDGVSGCEPCV